MDLPAVMGVRPLQQHGLLHDSLNCPLGNKGAGQEMILLPFPDFAKAHISVILTSFNNMKSDTHKHTMDGVSLR